MKEEGTTGRNWLIPYVVVSPWGFEAPGKPLAALVAMSLTHSLHSLDTKLI